MRVLGKRGMVASPHYLATGAGVAALRRGGSAADAAIATNAVLAVVTPYMCGVGGDLFAQVYTARDGRLVGLNSSGRAPRAATPERVRELAGGDQIPARGALAITVPGCVAGWGQLHRRFGYLPWRDLFSDAISYAEQGFPVSREFSQAVTASHAFFHPSTPAAATFLPAGRPPAEGEIFVQPRLARTLHAIAEVGPQAYYEGPIGQEIARAIQEAGGLMSPEDLAEHRADWVQPLSVPYRGYTIYELPPNSQGIIALIMLNILQQLPEERLREPGFQYVHTLAEAARLAYADREAFVTDMHHMQVQPESLLSQSYAQQRATRIGPRANTQALAGTPGDTIYLCTSDEDGNAVSLIESNFMGFGSGVMGGETGVMLQNRGHWFSLQPGHVNRIAPGKRTMHTLMPGMAFRDGKPWLVFGTMGGSTQAQIHVEILTRMIDQGMSLDEALAAPRFDAVVGSSADGLPLIQIEDRFPPQVIAELEAAGNAVELLPPFTSAMGHAHGIRFLDTGAYAGASDPRTDSLALGY